MKDIMVQIAEQLGITEPSTIVKELGGGGHKGACGFTMSFKTFRECFAPLTE
jgi:nanoRNase/pAp phosphatase (c-di-AMP/oligoRNAs hydrolase)